MIRRNNKILTLMLISLLLIIFFSAAMLTILIIFQYSGFYVFGATNNDLSLRYECKDQYLYKKHRLETNFRLRRSFVFSILVGIAGLVTFTMFIDFVYGLKLIRREYTGLVEQDQSQALKEFKKGFFLPKFTHRVCLYLALSVSAILEIIPSMHYFQMMYEHNNWKCPFSIDQPAVISLAIFSSLIVISHIISFVGLFKVTRELDNVNIKIRVLFEKERSRISMSSQEDLESPRQSMSSRAMTHEPIKQMMQPQEIREKGAKPQETTPLNSDENTFLDY